jgi:hypothetical protein
MKIFITLLALIYSTSTFGQREKKALLLWDGFYETNCHIEKGDDEGSQDYLRFYINGKVISVGTDCYGAADELKSWFNINAEQVATGDYKIKGRKIFFTTKSKTGLIQYKGRISNDKLLKLKWKSLINGNKGHGKYKFIQIASMT